MSNRHKLGNCFGRTRWNSYVTWVMWNLVLVYLEAVLVSVQDRCMVCAKRTMGSKFLLDAPDGTPRRCGSCQILFRSIWRQCQCRCVIGARFAPNVPLAQELFWTHPMVLLGDEAQVEARFCPIGDSANLDARWVHCLSRTYHRLGNCFGHT